MSQGLVVDLFAGGGGASVGIEAALGRPIDIAINHDAIALAVHKANHPETVHLEADLYEVKPREATGGQPVDVLWASPDCTHHSTAKGGKPLRQDIRSLAWVVVRWAAAVRPRVIFVENVPEFLSWGPLDGHDRPIKKRKGATFLRWRRQLEALGYNVEHRILDASLYGAPTRRRRVFIVARLDRRPVLWPEPTHGGDRLPLRTAAECIDWSLPCPSIFERKKPLAEKTQWRVAQGIRKFVFENARPFIVRMAHGEVAPDGVTRRRGHGQHSADQPLPTVQTNGGGGFGIVSPHLVKFRAEAHSSGPEEPVPAITADGHALGVLVPHLVKVNHGKPEARGESIEVPLTTVTATQRGHALVTPALVEMNHANAPHGVEEPLGVVTTQHNRFNLVAPSLVRYHGQKSETEAPRVEPCTDPLPTQTTENRFGLVAPLLAATGGLEYAGLPRPADKPVATVMPRDKRVLIAPTLVQTGYGEREGQAPRSLDIEQPLGTIIAGGNGGNGKHALVGAWLAKHFGGEVGQRLDQPASTITAQDHHGLAAVMLEPGQRHGRGQRDAREPLSTVVTKDRHAVSAATLVKLRGECAGAAIDGPMPALTAGGTHVAEVRAFLTAFYGSDGGRGKGQSLRDPMRSLTAKHRLGLVTIAGVEYQIVDIGLRMLQPHELLRAQFGEFAEGYDLSAARGKSGKPSKSAEVRLIGNSVCPHPARALVAENVPEGVKRAA